MKWDNQNHERNKNYWNTNNQTLRINNVQQDENVWTKNHARNELITKTQLIN